MPQQPEEDASEGGEAWIGRVGPITVSDEETPEREAWKVAGRIAQAAHSLSDLADLVSSHPDPRVRCGAIPRLRARFPEEPRTLQVLKAASEDDTAWVREAAVMALGNLGPARAADAIAARLQDPDFDVRSTAAEELKFLGDPRAPADPEAWALQTLVDGPEPPVRDDTDA